MRRNETSVETVSIFSKACLYQFHDASKGVKAIKQIISIDIKSNFITNQITCFFLFDFDPSSLSKKIVINRLLILLLFMNKKTSQHYF